MSWSEIIGDWIGLKYQQYPIGKTEISNDLGHIIWFKNSNSQNKIIVHEIYVNFEHRNKGLCREFLNQLIDLIHPETKQIIIQAVLSPILYNFLCRFEYKGKKFKIIKGEWTYLV